MGRVTEYILLMNNKLTTGQINSLSYIEASKRQKTKSQTAISKAK